MKPSGTKYGKCFLGMTLPHSVQIVDKCVLFASTLGHLDITIPPYVTYEAFLVLQLETDLLEDSPALR